MKTFLEKIPRHKFKTVLFIIAIIILIAIFTGNIDIMQLRGQILFVLSFIWVFVWPMLVSRGY